MIGSKSSCVVSETPGSFGLGFDLPKDRVAPFRPIQYLGSKLRSLELIVPEIKERVTEGGICLDLFAGTTVVGQALSNYCSVISNDAAPFSKLFGDVLVVGSSKKRKRDLHSVVFEIVKSSAFKNNYDYLIGIYYRAIEDEKRATTCKNASEFEALCNNIPSVATPSSSKYKSIQQFINCLNIDQKRRNRFSKPGCLFTAYYAGNYFGIEQSIAIDSFRYALEKYYTDNRISENEYKAVLCALISSVSKTVSSAGKHFAQPLIIGGQKQRPFAISRAMEDRTYSILEEINKAIFEIERILMTPKMNGESYQVRFEDLILNCEKLGAVKGFDACFRHQYVDCIYADPPYTAQQYSRFYHVLDTLIYYDYPDLQINSVTGEITQGLYRDNRFKSAFCNKTEAKTVFSSLFKISKYTAKYLLLSYSRTNTTSGNPRMISEEDILGLGKQYAVSTKEVHLQHSYRKLNKLSLNKKDSDPEILYIFEFNKHE